MNTQAATIQSKLANAWAEVYPDKPFEESCKIVNPLKAKDGNTYSAVFKDYWSESYIATKDATKMDAILRMADYFLTDENKVMLRYGFEGEDYTVSADGTKVPNEGVVLYEKYPFTNISGLIEWDNSISGLKPSGNKENDKYIKMVSDYYSKIEKTTLPDFEPAYTNISTPLKNKFIIKPADDLLTIMTGTESVEKMYKDLMANYESKGLSKMIDEVNAVIKAK